MIIGFSSRTTDFWWGSKDWAVVFGDPRISPLLAWPDVVLRNAIDDGWSFEWLGLLWF